MVDKCDVPINAEQQAAVFRAAGQFIINSQNASMIKGADVNSILRPAKAAVDHAIKCNGISEEEKPKFDAAVAALKNALEKRDFSALTGDVAKTLIQHGNALSKSFAVVEEGGASHPAPRPVSRPGSTTIASR